MDNNLLEFLNKRLEEEKVRHNAGISIYGGFAKGGKTSALLQIGKGILIDFDEGMEMYNSIAKNNIASTENSIMPITIHTFDDYIKLVSMLRKSEQKPDFIIIDSITSLYDRFSNTMGVLQFNKDNKKSLSLSENVRQQGFGTGHAAVKSAIMSTINSLKSQCEHLIIIAHLEKVVTENVESVGWQLLLSKKLAVSIPSICDSVGTFKRCTSNNKAIRLLVDQEGITLDVAKSLYKGHTFNILDFNGSDNVPNFGTRCKHLANKEIIISAYNNENGEIKTFWNRIFI